jgi:hypothetical protein
MDAVWVVLVGWLALSLLVAIAWAIVRRGSSERSERLDDHGVAKARERYRRSEESGVDTPVDPGERSAQD